MKNKNSKLKVEDNKIIKTKNKKKPNNEIMKITYIFLFIFFIMIGYYVNFLLKDSDEIINNSYNKRQEVLEKVIIRGNILSNNNQILATTLIDENGIETRNYPFGNLFAHSVGYSSHGAFGVESLANYKLLTSNSPFMEKALKDFKGEKNTGDNIVTSLDVDLTKAANEALGENQGAVIALDPSTGKILTMVSKPDFDPNTIDNIWDDLISDDSKSNLVNRTTSGRYTPGSTFKLFTLLEYINENPDYNTYSYDCQSRITVDDITISCANGKWHGGETLIDSFANSCNSSFVNLGLTLNKTSFKQLCNRLLFNSELPVSYPYNKSSFVLDETSSTFDIMQTVIGQGKTTVSPIHLALIASAIANDGMLMKPYVVTNVINGAGKKITTYSPTEYKKIFFPNEVSVLKEYLRAVVTNGTGTKLNTEAYTAYGKTGTAQINDGSQNNSLFMGYAENGNKKIAICVVMEDMPEGSTFAVPAAKKVIDVYFSKN